jgi:hypothetical protein
MAKTTEDSNKALILEAFDTLFSKRDYKAVERYWSSNYIQHNAHIAPGRDGLFNLVRSMPPTLKYEPGVIVAENDQGADAPRDKRRAPKQFSEVGGGRHLDGDRRVPEKRRGPRLVRTNDAISPRTAHRRRRTQLRATNRGGLAPRAGAETRRPSSAQRWPPYE